MHLVFFGTHEALDHTTSFPSSRETIPWLGIEPPTTPFGLGPLSSGSSGSSQTFEKKTKFFETTLVPFTTLLSNYTMVSFQRKMLRLKNYINLQLLVKKFIADDVRSPREHGLLDLKENYTHVIHDSMDT